MIHKSIYLIGQKLRNPSIKRQLKFLKGAENWSLEQLENYQFKKLKEIVDFAFNNSEYYNRKMLEIGISPSNIKSLKDIEKLPVLSKRDLLIYNSEIQSSFKFKKTFKAVTSGSSGNSLMFYRDEYADSFNRAASIRGYSWYGVKPWERNAYFWGYNFNRLKRLVTFFLDLIQNRFRTFDYSNDSLSKFVKKAKKAKYIHGYSSMIYEVAKLINQRNLPQLENIKMVKGTSEKIFESYQQEITKAFGIKMISEYGATESGVIAFECPNGNMHLNMESVYVEDVNNEILVTNLQMKSFPIIRYRLGDYIKLAPREKKCDCGLNHLILEEVTGRIGAKIYGKKNIYPSLYFYYIFKNLDSNCNLKLNYQVIQKIKGELVFNISNKLNKENFQQLEKEIKKYFNFDIDFVINDFVEIKSKEEKLKSFISKL